MQLNTIKTKTHGMDMHGFQLMEGGIPEGDASILFHIFSNSIVYKPDLVKLSVLLSGHRKTSFGNEVSGAHIRTCTWHLILFSFSCFRT